MTRPLSWTLWNSAGDSPRCQRPAVRLSPGFSRAEYRQWLEALVNAQAAYGVAPQVLASVIRISTHTRIYAQPSALDEAIKFCRTLLAPDTCTVIHPGDRHWDIFVDLCAKSGATGNLIQDAWFAALAIESGCEWVTTDRDYGKFPGLRWRTPF